MMSKKLTSELFGQEALAASENLLAKEYQAYALGCVSTLGTSDPIACNCSASREEGCWPPSHMHSSSLLSIASIASLSIFAKLKN